ncbi:hypothetical protein M0805_007993 [Coniferiporia weirii]|nr:hypothetical protein M0805_007993 [Coniferiporia weirii]
MSIAASQCLSAFNSSTLRAARESREWLRCWQCRRSYSARVDLPPHLSRPAHSSDSIRAQRQPRIHDSSSIYRPHPRTLIKPYYITTPIFYPNAVPHIGHLYSMVIGDIYARHARCTMPHRPVHFVTGTDEHGMKIQKAAKDRGMGPKELCDHLSHAFGSLAERAQITHTKFVRTTAEEHHSGVKKLWDDLYQRGYIYKGKHKGWYCISDEAFYTDSQVRSQIDPKTGNEVKVSIETGNLVEWTEEENYKFALSKLRDRLKEHFIANPHAIYPPRERDSIMATLESQDLKLLPDLSISRPSSRLTWGIRVPNDESQTIYVWLDALTSYLTGIGYPWTNAEEMHSSGWPVDLQIIGKDILRFHALYFPAFLMALDMPLPRSLLSHAHWTVCKSKMSKSVGNVVDPVAVLKEHGQDAVRWYLARVGGTFKDDVDWDTDQLRKHEVELRSLLGNILLRMQSKKILEKLPAAFQEVPLHRSVLMTRGNAPIPLSTPGTPEYEDVMEDRLFLHDYMKPDTKGEVDYAKEYTERALRAVRSEDTGSDQYAIKLIAYSELPESEAEGDAPIVSPELRDALDILRGKVSYHLQQREVSLATRSIVDVLALLNKEFTRIAPWTPNTPARDVIHLLIWTRETLRICAILLQPYIPKSSSALLDALRVQGGARTYAFARIGAGRVSSGPVQRRVLFPTAQQRVLDEVEADHRWEENLRKKKQVKEPLRADIRHEPRRKERENGLYAQIFNPHGSLFRPNGEIRREKLSRSQAMSARRMRRDRKRSASYAKLIEKRATKKRERLAI